MTGNGREKEARKRRTITEEDSKWARQRDGDLKGTERECKDGEIRKKGLCRKKKERESEKKRGNQKKNRKSEKNQKS